MQIRGVTEGVIEHLRDQIVTGELNAGQRLNENHLAASIGVSRPPLHEAFRVLQHERLIASIRFSRARRRKKQGEGDVYLRRTPDKGDAFVTRPPVCVLNKAAAVEAPRQIVISRRRSHVCL